MPAPASLIDSWLAASWSLHVSLTLLFQALQHGGDERSAARGPAGLCPSFPASMAGLHGLVQSPACTSENDRLRIRRMACLERHMRRCTGMLAPADSKDVAVSEGGAGPARVYCYAPKICSVYMVMLYQMKMKSAQWQAQRRFAFLQVSRAGVNFFNLVYGGAVLINFLACLWYAMAIRGQAYYACGSRLPVSYQHLSEVPHKYCITSTATLPCCLCPSRLQLCIKLCKVQSM